MAVIKTLWPKSAWGEKGLFHLAAHSPWSERVWVGTQRRFLEPERDAEAIEECCLLNCLPHGLLSCFLLQHRTTCSRVVLPTMGCPLLHYPSIKKKMHHMLSRRLSWWESFLSWGFLFWSWHKTSQHKPLLGHNLKDSTTSQLCHSKDTNSGKTHENWPKPPQSASQVLLHSEFTWSAFWEVQCQPPSSRYSEFSDMFSPCYGTVINYQKWPTECNWPP